MPRRPARILAVLLIGVAVGRGASRTETLVIATYNIENYCPVDRLTDAGYRSDYPKPESEKQALREVIRRIDADVLALQEMGPRPYLEELRRDLRAEGLDYAFCALAEAGDANRHVALLSRRPLIGVVTHADLEFPYLGGRETVKRGLLEAKIMTASGVLTIFAVHLKSHLTEHPDDPEAALRRAAEAAAVRDCVLRRVANPASARFVILGDCNDGRRSVALARLQRRGSMPVSERLPAADSRGETWTEIWRRQDTYSELDHILVSPALRAAVLGGNARIDDGPGVGDASDHRPVIAVLTFPLP
jgi:endonuclease/exonuclease/phosphatase family metal-dependent hydrolase